MEVIFHNFEMRTLRYSSVSKYWDILNIHSYGTKLVFTKYFVNELVIDETQQEKLLNNLFAKPWYSSVEK